MIKKIAILALSATFLVSCGKSKSGTQIGEEVCECSKKANAMDPADPKRAEAQKDCSVKQGEAWNKVKDDQKKADEFNAVLAKCAEEQIKKSFGQ
ncbi:MAG: hypothetical protein IPG86_06060 [Chitinophagaceae bacterium]|nr:hypothetical protein [Chitinophagaceae bacterium]